MTVRVLRFIEYIYDTPELAENDMAKWQMPAIGTRYLGGGKVLKSAIITDLNFIDEPTEVAKRQLPRSCKVHICSRGFCYTCSLISPFQNPHHYATRSRNQVPPRGIPVDEVISSLLEED